MIAAPTRSIGIPPPKTAQLAQVRQTTAPKSAIRRASLRQVAAAVELVPRDRRAIELLDELEELTGARPREIREPSGARTYDLDAARMSVDGLDETLDRIDSDWREHLSYIP